MTITEVTVEPLLEPTVTARPAPGTTRLGRKARIAASGRAFRRWFGRWYKMVIPIGIGLLILAMTFVAHTVQSDDVKDPDFLNPTSSAGVGGSTLARALAAKGIAVDRVTTDQEAFSAVQNATTPATLFVPSLELTRPEFAAALQALPAGTRVVIVAPGDARLSVAGSQTWVVATRWATISAPAGCAMAEAVAAGPAEVDRVEYSSDGATDVCYDGGLVETDDRFSGVDEIFVGASDPFRNNRIGEVGNEALAVGLLSTRSEVVWLDTHTAPPREQSAPVTDDNRPPPDVARKTLGDLLPPWVWAGIGLLLLAGAALAVAAGRRLGGPVTEPLPVAARINETVEGRGRLYRRTRDRPAVLAVLQAAAIERIRIATGLPAGAPEADVVGVTSTYLDIPPDEVRRILYAGEAEDDEALMYAVASLDAISEFASPHGTAPSLPENNEGAS